jgi:hypothetical protein
VPGKRPYAHDSEEPFFSINTMTKIWQVKCESKDLDHLKYREHDLWILLSNSHDKKNYTM